MTATTVKVKPLVWRQVDDDDFEAAKYNCHIVSDGKGWGLAPLGWPCLGDHPYPTLEAAKAAAQADYEASILSAIEVPDLDAHIGAVLEDWKSRIENLWITADNDREEGYDEGLQAVLEELPFVRPDAQQAIERVRREARVEGMRAALAIADQMERQNGPLSKRGFPEQYRKGLEAAGNAIANAIRALIEAERGKP